MKASGPLRNDSLQDIASSAHTYPAYLSDSPGLKELGIC